MELCRRPPSFLDSRAPANARFTGLPVDHRPTARTYSMLFYSAILEQRHKRRGMDNVILVLHNIHQHLRHAWLC